MTRPSSARSRKATKAPPPARPGRPEFPTHHLIPPHELVGEDEGRAILEELSTPLERLPKILVSDPGLKTDPKFRAAREAGEPLNGRLIRIRRPSPTAGEAVAYRVLVSSVSE
jgi:DNA-directed RNA polymerase subunit H (RpoH/RPB5)